MNLQAYFDPDMIEAGCDEAGRGCLAGPVFAAAVILDKDFEHDWLKDSKKMTEKRRAILRTIIEENALAWAVATASVEEIDAINIAQASYLAMHRAVDAVCKKLKPEMLLIDGKHFNKYPNIAHKCIIKGDSKFAAIAAASVLAKTHRDEYMLKLTEEYPIYDWQINKGYPTKKHREAIRIYDASPYHRTSFRLLPEEDKQLIIKY